MIQRPRVGSEQEMVTIEMIADGFVHTLNSMGARRTMPIQWSGGKGPPPVVGETWLIERQFGRWMLSMCLDPILPQVTGDIVEDGKAQRIIEALVAQGAITADINLIAAVASNDAPLHGRLWFYA